MPIFYGVVVYMCFAFSTKCKMLLVASRRTVFVHFLLDVCPVSILDHIVVHASEVRNCGSQLRPDQVLWPHIPSYPSVFLLLHPTQPPYA